VVGDAMSGIEFQAAGDEHDGRKQFLVARIIPSRLNLKMIFIRKIHERHQIKQQVTVFSKSPIKCRSKSWYLFEFFRVFCK